MTEMNYDADRPKAENPVKDNGSDAARRPPVLFATRGRTEDMIPVAEMMDEVGFWAVETWGGATFDTMHRFLNEDPWERIRTLKRYFKKTPFSMLLRAQNLVGYRNYADDVANAFMDRACENGMDVFRTFDALNDYRNFETVVPKIKEYGKHFQGCICYTMTEPRLGGEVYNLDYYVNKAKDLEAMGADSICVKDMAGLIAPYDAYAIVKALKAAVKVPDSPAQPLHLGHVAHEPSQGHRGGVDIIDTCMTPYAYRTSHAAIEPLVMAFWAPTATRVSTSAAGPAINEVLEKEVMPKYKHLLDDSKMSIIDINVLLAPDPGRDALQPGQPAARDGRPGQDRRGVQGAAAGEKGAGSDSAGDAHQPDRGDPDGEQRAVRHARGALQDDHRPGQGPVLRPVRQDRGAHRRGGSEKGAQGLCERGEEPITCRPAEVLEPELEKAKEEIGDLAVDMDDLVLYAIYPVTGKKFLQWKYGKEEVPTVNEGETVVILEAMKMENALSAPASGTVKAINYASGDSVAKGDVLCVIG
jgi:pyruvate carboxylase subunit B